MHALERLVPAQDGEGLAELTWEGKEVYEKALEGEGPILLSKVTLNENGARGIEGSRGEGLNRPRTKRGWKNESKRLACMTRRPNGSGGELHFS